MSFRSTTIRTARSALKPETCLFCRFRATQPVRRYAAPKAYPIARVEQQKRTPAQMRFDIDKRSRGAYLYMMKKENLLQLPPPVAEKLIGEFLEADRDKADPASNVQQLAKKYNRLVGDITYIAIPLLRIPDVNDANARLPPSQHPMMAARMLLACSAAKDSLATLQILAAVYHRDNNGIPQARDIARLFSTAEIKACTKMLEQLAEEGDTDAMTLHGQFLERSGHNVSAKHWYEQAVEHCKTKFDPRYPHPMALPREQPWIALANRMLSENTPEARAKAKAVLEKGAFKAGDPLAYYQLASLEDGTSPAWLTYMSKAAASGHLEAKHKLGHYYMDVDADPSSYLNNPRLRQALKFVTNWRPGSVQSLAKEWFAVAAAGGHKPAMLELAELSSTEGDELGATTWLRHITDPPRSGETEEWPKLVEQARKRLAGLGVARPKPA